MNIFVYSDESGVFDKEHNDFFVFGGILFLSKDERDIASRKYISAEKAIRNTEKMSFAEEVKATSISVKSKNKLYRSLNSIEQFGVIVEQKKLNDKIFTEKKHKQRYLDWAYKIAIKKKLLSLISEKKIIPSEVENIYFFVDEHSTATSGVYELEQSLETEFKIGNFNENWTVFHEPLFPELKSLKVNFRNSGSTTLVRAADIVANKLFYHANNPETKPEKIFYIRLPHEKK